MIFRIILVLVLVLGCYGTNPVLGQDVLSLEKLPNALQALQGNEIRYRKNYLGKSVQASGRFLRLSPIANQ